MRICSPSNFRFGAFGFAVSTGRNATTTVRPQSYPPKPTSGLCQSNPSFVRVARLPPQSTRTALADQRDPDFRPSGFTSGPYRFNPMRHQVREVQWESSRCIHGGRALRRRGNVSQLDGQRLSSGILVSLSTNANKACCDRSRRVISRLICSRLVATRSSAPMIASSRAVNSWSIAALRKTLGLA